jgi:hypothetical protein
MAQGLPGLRLACAAAALAVVGAAGSAHAGRTRFAWLYDAETVPQRGVELETWLQETEGRGAAGIDETLLWWAPVIGLTDRVELVLPVELLWTRSAGASQTRLERFGAEVRWRLVDPDPVEAGPFAPLLRLAVKRLVNERNSVRLEGGAVLALDVGPARLVADLEAVVTIDGDQKKALVQALPGAGVSFAVAGELRLGVEATSVLQLSDTPAPSWVAVGPDLSFTHGRSWLSAAVLIGVHHIDLAPRLVWAIAF